MSKSSYLYMHNISKSFPGVKALTNVNLEVKCGEVHALLGENGAGKSTLLKILSGAYTKDEGEIIINGKKIEQMTTQLAMEMGIAVIYQEFNNLPHLSIAENIFLGKQPLKKNGLIDWKGCYEKSEELLKKVGLDIDPRTTVSNLKVAQQQMVEIAKALSQNAKIIVMDEPTAPLTQIEIDNLFRVIRELKANNVAIIYVSHRLVEIKEICDRITFLRDGCYVGDADVADVSISDMIRMMVGRDLTDMFPKSKAVIGEPILEIEDFSTRDKLKNIELKLHRGEILGLAGLVGSGRTELARAIMGADPISSGKMKINNQYIKIKNVRHAISNKIGLVPEDRKKQGLVLIMDLIKNTTLASLKKYMAVGKLNLGKERRDTESHIDRLHIATPDAWTIVENLSGGNQQKVVLSKWLCAECEVLIIDEPTRGIDVGAKVEIYELMNELVEKGMAILMISSEMQELIGVCDRILVMHEGQIAGELDRSKFSEEKIMAYATGQMLE